MKALVAAGWALMIAATLSPQQQFRARVDVVRLDVSVTDDQGHVRGLGAGDFVVRDDGVVQSVTVEEFIDTPLDVVLVAPPLSAVNYIAADQVTRTAVGIEGFLHEIEPRDRLAVVLASPPPRVLRRLEPGRPMEGASVFAAGTHFYSASFDAIALGLRLFTPSERRPAIVAFTTAGDFRSVLSSEAVAELVARRGPTFVVVGTPVTVQQQVRVSGEFVDGRPVGDPVEGAVAGRLLSHALLRFARTSGGLLVNLADDDPRQAMVRLVTSLRSRYVLTYPLPQGDGWRPVDVRVNRRGVKVDVRTGYFVQ